MNYEKLDRVLAMLNRPLEMDEKGKLPFYYIGRQALEETASTIKELGFWLKQIENIAREAFSDPDTRDINLYRAQALAKIYQIFEYNGSAIERSGKDE